MVGVVNNAVDFGAPTKEPPVIGAWLIGLTTLAALIIIATAATCGEITEEFGAARVAIIRI